MGTLFKAYGEYRQIGVPANAAPEVTETDMSSQDVFLQQFEQLLHHYQEALSTTDAGEMQASNWKSLSPDQRNRVVAAARLAILEMETNARLEENSRKYFAKPGHAEWGC